MDTIVNVDEFIRFMPNMQKYQTLLNGLNFTWENIEVNAEMNCPTEAKTILPTMASTREGFSRLEVQLIENLVREEIKKVILEITSKAQVAVDILIRNLYERTADVGFLATDDDIRRFLTNPAPGRNDEESITTRLREYRDKYTVYDEIIVLDIQGKVRAHLDEKSPIMFSKDPLIRETLASDTYVETFRRSDLRPALDRTLIYSQKIEHPDTGEQIGVLCLCFRFEDEMQGIFNNLKKKGDKSVMLLLDREGTVISSSDEDHVRIGRALEMVVDDEYRVVDFAGRNYIATTCATRGYQGYFGMGWFGHVMIPLESAFCQARTNALDLIDKEIIDGIMGHAESFCPALSSIAKGADVINLSLRRVVWNGQVMAAGKRGDLLKLKAILRQISKTGDKTSSVFADSIKNLYETVISSSLQDVQFIARLMIDIMDRNLYERANDCRWWALASDLRRILAAGNPSPEELAKMTDILEYINGLYTVYTRLFVYDLNGTILAASNLHDDGLSVCGRKFESGYTQKVFQLETSQSYNVSPFEATWLYNDRHTYIYNAAIRDPENPAKVVGGIGIVFDSEPQFKDMLLDSLPNKQGTFGIFTDRNGRIVSSTCPEHQVGSVLDINPEFFTLGNGEGMSNIIVHRGKYYIVGCMTSFGYREYKNSGDYTNDIISFAFVPLGDEKEKGENAAKPATLYATTQTKGNVVELATFFAADRMFAITAPEVVEAIESGRLTPLPGSRPYLAGTISFNNTVIPVINLRHLFGKDGGSRRADDQIIITKTNRGLVGLIVDDLDSVPEFEADRIEAVPEMIKHDAGYIRNVISRDGDCEQEMLVVLDPDLILNAVQKRPDEY
ncbi:MAG: chemotaxis protein CheW [Geobacter sp.]|nr:MAG: chemotaxis protein CheW [Geobacter sp.]